MQLSGAATLLCTQIISHTGKARRVLSYLIFVRSHIKEERILMRDAHEGGAHIKEDHPAGAGDMRLIRNARDYDE